MNWYVTDQAEGADIVMTPFTYIVKCLFLEVH